MKNWFRNIGIAALIAIGSLHIGSIDVRAAGVPETGTEYFSWDNSLVYFAITDRFYNGNTGNDHSYGRSVGEVDADNYQTRTGTFHGGDYAGMTEKIKEGYFDALGVNVLWVSAPYEQMHGAVCAEGFKHYAYHGYYPLDFTNMDANMGTEQEFMEFVQTAHKHGIRVVLDVVLNHVGYADPVTAVEYGFGGVTNNWEEIYYNTSEKDYDWTMDYTGEREDGYATLDSAADWSNWWGSSWVRAVTGRYDGYSGSLSDTNYKLCLGGLPDIKTEDTNDNGIPCLLRKKWEKEGRLVEEEEELNNFFQESGLERKNVNYVIKWLTDWVREYGIDGFRCDSVKHVEIENWAVLKNQAEIALKEWREKNPDDIAASWDEDFWMVGENFDFANAKDKHFDYGFDSMVNLQFQGYESRESSALDYVYKSYAQEINTDSGFNMLTYISSHDTRLGIRSKQACNNLLMCPGEVQIYYGDETGRTTEGISGEQGLRTQMNWDSINEDLLEHYRRVGTFRTNHKAIAMGSHTKLQTVPYVFSRVYEEYGEITDKVVVAMPESAGKVSVKVEGVFDEGEIVRDAYSAKEYQVITGYVEAECDDGGIVLLESAGKREAAIGARVSGGSLPFTGESILVSLYSYGVDSTEYSVNDNGWHTYENGKQITIGGGFAYGEHAELVLRGTVDGQKIERKFTYTKAEAADPKNEMIVSVRKDEFEEAPYCYVYSGYNTLSSVWPGTLMQEDGKYYSYRRDGVAGDVYYIISTQDGSFRSTPDGESGLRYSGQTLFTIRDGETMRPLDAQGRVNVHYVEQSSGKVIKEVYRVGKVGSSYTTSRAVLRGYTILSEPANQQGVFEADVIDVYYYYKKNVLQISQTESEGIITVSANELMLPRESRFMFSVIQGNGREILLRNFSEDCTIKLPAERYSGCRIEVSAIHDGEISSRELILQ